MFNATVKATSATAQPLPPLDEFQIRTFDARSGLVGADVRGLAQGRDGFIYVSNPRGLSRFDGHGFRRVELPGLINSYVAGIKRDRQGRLWVRTEGSDLGYLENDRFHLLPAVPVPFSFWTETNDGVLWLGGADGLIRVDPTDTSPYTLFGEADGLPREVVAGVVDLPSGERIAVTNRRLARLTIDTTRRSGIRIEPFGDVFEGAAHEGDELRVDARGLWFSAYQQRDGRSHLVRYLAGQFTYYGSGGVPPLDVDSLGWESSPDSNVYLSLALHMTVRGKTDVPALSALRLSQAYRGRGDNRWYSFSDANDNHPQLARRRGNSLEMVDLQSYLVFARLRHVFEDHEGSLWIGTDRGLVQLVPRKIFALTVANGLAAEFTAPIQQTRDRALWIGTYGGGVQKFAEGKLAKTFTTNDGLPFNQVRALHEARDGRVWVGTSLGYAIIARDQVVRSVRISGETRSFAEADDGTMWVGSENALIRDRDGRVTRHAPAFWNGRGIWALHAARDGALWVGSERGLFRLIGDSVQSFGERDGLRNGFVASIAEEPDGTLWFGTYNHGLHRYRGKRFVAITTEHGLHNNGVWRVLSDELGGVWMSSDQGIFRVRRDTLHAVADAIERGERHSRRLAPIVFTESEGMPNRESNRASPGGWRLDDGRLVFNNLAGVVVIDPRRVAEAPPAPRAVIHGVSADGVVLPPGEVQISARTRQLSIDFAALSYLAPEQNHFRYRVDGYDRDWVEAGTVRRATYTNLSPGRFTFRVQGATSTGDWSGTEATVAFEVVPLVWQTLWFRLLIGSALAGALVVAYRYRVQRLLEMERLRLRIASDLHDDVGSNLSSIALLSDMLKDVKQLDVPEQRQIRRINTAAEETIGALRDIIWLVDPKHGDLVDLIVRLRRVAGDMLPGHEWTFTDGPAPSHPLSMVTMRNTLLIYKEILHNIVKHAQAQRVTIRIGTQRDRLLLEVEDDGVGFDAAAAHAGHGVASMRRRAEQSQGTLAFDRVRPRGTRVTFSTRLP